MWRYAVTIFLSAFLLFLVQPLIGKFILPWFGGGPGVWTACMLFFQIALLVGYTYAHLVVMRLKPTAQMWVHVVLLLIAMACLPIIPDEAWKPQPEQEPVWRILLLLGVTIGLPFVALSATAPLMQAWFASAVPEKSPYRLYALSNAGSLLALLGYPFVVEPLLSRRAQAMIWSGGFVVFAILCAFVAITSRNSSSVEGLNSRDSTSRGAHERKSSREPLARGYETSLSQLALWLLLPACAVIMLLSITSRFSEEVAPMPFLWVLTLAAYLLSFIICFEWPRLYHRGVFMVLALMSPWIVWLMLQQASLGLGVQFAAYLLILFCCCMTCHGELHRLRPEAGRLTAYYLCIAVGGAIGGAFVSILAPLIFNGTPEFFIAMYGGLALLLICMWRDAGSVFHRGKHRLGWLAFVLCAMAAGYLLRLETSDRNWNIRERVRNFYGSLRLVVHAGPVEGSEYREMNHGRIAHGAQIFHETREDLRQMPTTYFGPHTGIGIVLSDETVWPRATEVAGPSGRRIGVIGLGAGTAAAYARSGDAFRFYEINPQVVDMANGQFTFLADARSRGANVDIILNDARLALEREEPQEFDALVLDAFTGDAIPIHLLTLEAFGLYEKHLAADGVMAIHISNSYLDLRPVVYQLATTLGYTVAFVQSPADTAKMWSQATWVIVTKNQRVLDLPELRARGFFPTRSPEVRLWTDDHHSLLDALR